MLNCFEKIISNIYRLRVPFEDLYTSIFLIRSEQDNILVDCATYESDVDKFLLPALSDLGLSLNDITYLILTHTHRDHAGGLKRILQYNPHITVLQDTSKSALPGRIVYELKGHTLDCIGAFVEQSGTLISGDGLQGHGVGKYRCSLESEDEYLRTIERIEKDERIKNILFSHAYEPWNTDVAFGREAVENCLQDCIEYVQKRKM